MTIRLIRNATLRIGYAGKTFLVDPWLSPRFSRPSYAGKSRNPLVDLPVGIGEILDGVDWVVVSHMHSDHFDVVAREVLPRSVPLICQRPDLEALRALGFSRISCLEDRLRLDDILVTRTPGRHGSGPVLDDMGSVMGFMLSSGSEPSLYWAGDTVLTDEIRTLVAEHAPELIVTHSCGAVWGEGTLIVMDDAQTIELARAASSSRIVAVHMEAVDHATVTRKDLRLSAERAGIGADRLFIPADGEELVFARTAPADGAS